jgi:signal transduction histidine kinase
VNTWNQSVSRFVLPVAIAALPVVLLVSSIRTFRELDEQRAVYLRHRVAVVAARLENLPPGGSGESILGILGEEEPDLADVEVVARGGPGDEPGLAPLWAGQELFRTGFRRVSSGDLFRAYVPFHSVEGLHIARIDLRAAAADFLVVHARHNVIASSLGGLVLVALSVYAVWSARRAARLRLRQMEMEHLAHIGSMAAVLAHEIRNPLGTIKGFAQVAAERVDPPVRELLAPILSETRRLEALVTDLLAYGRPPVPDPRPVEWAEVARGLEGHARQYIGARPVRLVIGSAALRFTSDPQLLEQALLNLLRNAVEAIPPGAAGEVQVEAAAGEKKGLAISITDNGPGLAESTRARLFEPFFTTKAAGTGLGLAITRKLVRSLGGELELRSVPGCTEAVARFPDAAVETTAQVS